MKINECIKCRNHVANEVQWTFELRWNFFLSRPVQIHLAQDIHRFDKLVDYINRVERVDLLRAPKSNRLAILLQFELKTTPSSQEPSFILRQIIELHVIYLRLVAAVSFTMGRDPRPVFVFETKFAWCVSGIAKCAEH